MAAEPESRGSENGLVSAERGASGGENGTVGSAVLSRVDGYVLPAVGGFGAFQKRLVALTWIPALFIGFSHFSDYFLLAQPNSTCADANSTHSGTDGNRTCACTYDELQTGLAQNVVTMWNLMCDSAAQVHIAKFSLLVGSIFGYLVLGVLADWIGRHLVLIISVFFTLVFGMTVAFSVNVTMFSTLRFFEGFFLAGITLSLYVLRIELCLPAWRFSMAMVASFLMLAGQLLMPAVAAACGDWRLLQAVIIGPLLLMFSYIWIFPESLRWLLATQQYERAKMILERIAKTNRASVESDELLTELHRVLPKKPKRTCIVKMVGTRNLWKNIVVLCVNSLTGFGIHHCFARSMMDPDAKEETMFHNFYADYYTMAGIAVATCLAMCPAVGLMGRRGGLLMFMIITALASLLQLGLLNLLGKYSVQLKIEESDTLKSRFSVAFSIIGMFSSHAASNLSIFFCAEVTPTVIRGGGLGLVLASAGFGMLTAPIMELHNQKGYFLHHVIFACCTLICIICILLLPETRNQPLPETLPDGESFTRQPLLLPRKAAEQRHLLHATGSARASSTPLHAAAAAAASTMESTASSTLDLALAQPHCLPLSVLRHHREPGEPREPGESAEPPGGTVFTTIPNASTPLSTSPNHPSKTDSLPDLIANVPPPHCPSSETLPIARLTGHTPSHTPETLSSPSTATETPPLTFNHTWPQPVHLIPETTPTQQYEHASYQTPPTETMPLPPCDQPSQSVPVDAETTPPFDSTDDAVITDITEAPPPTLINHTPMGMTDTPPPPETGHIPSQPETDSAVVAGPDSRTEMHCLLDSVGGAADTRTISPTPDAAIELNDVALAPPMDPPLHLANGLNSLHPANANPLLDVLRSISSSSTSPIDSDVLLFPPPVTDPAHLETPSPSSVGAPVLSDAAEVSPAGDTFTVDLTVSTPIDFPSPVNSMPSS
ncbi:solute carrier family 22 member 23-like [Hoplias malabaricus]|uniref:solute carrier family 22 member 23-like n=1 Tax=Hoplias malabaricus TaxID=27720 RepID=UPI003461FACB